MFHFSLFLVASERGERTVKHTYMDDVVIHSCCWEEHLASVTQILTKFAEADLTVNLG